MFLPFKIKGGLLVMYFLSKLVNLVIKWTQLTNSPHKNNLKDAVSVLFFCQLYMTIRHYEFVRSKYVHVEIVTGCK